MTTGTSTAVRFTCVLATPGRYELVWTNPAGSARPSGDAGPSLPMSRPVYDDIHTALDRCAPEAGGLLLGPRNTRLVTHFLFDAEGSGTSATYTLHHVSLNRALRPFLACGINIKGIVHSHSPGQPAPTAGDRQYLDRLLQSHPTPEFFFPVWCERVLTPFVVTPESLPTPDWARPAHLVLL